MVPVHSSELGYSEHDGLEHGYSEHGWYYSEDGCSEPGCSERGYSEITSEPCYTDMVVFNVGDLTETNLWIDEGGSEHGYSEHGW